MSRSAVEVLAEYLRGTIVADTSVGEDTESMAQEVCDALAEAGLVCVPRTMAVNHDAYVSLAVDFWNYLEGLRDQWENDENAPLIQACMTKYEELTA